MILKSILILILSIIGGLYYREGGSQYGYRWYRPLGMSMCSGLVLILLGYLHWTLILSAGAFYGLSTTYFKKKGTDAKWWNWVLVGIAFSIAVLPIVLVYNNWLGFGIRTSICTILIPLWNLKISNYLAYHFRKTISDDVIEEFGRGMIVILTLPLIIIS